MRQFHVQTIGCQMNEYDSERLAQAFADSGWSRASGEEAADALILNTCTVRQLAEHKAFSLLGRWVRLKDTKPGLVVGMVGCLAQHLAGAAFKREPGLDFIAGPRALTSVPSLAEAAREGRHPAETGDTGYGAGVGGAAASALSASVGIMEGCDQFCTYCAVPRARGRETSRPAAEIAAEVERRVAAGAREILLLGQNVNRYGRGLGPDRDFAALLGRVAALPGVLRLRFMTGHPHGFSERVIACLADLPPLCEALHLPVQSGSDRILAAMHRGYTAEDYLALTRRIRAAVPGMVFTTDVIVGFPGETDSDFQATLDLLEAVPVDQAYCFKYSPRQGTPAAGLPDQVPQEVKEARLERLLQTVRRLALASQAALVGKTEQVLVELVSSKRPGHLQGRSRTNRWITFPGPAEWVGRELSVRITAAEALTLAGEAEP